MEIWVKAGGRGGNTITVLLPRVEGEKVTGLEAVEMRQGLWWMVFQTIWRLPSAAGVLNHLRN